MTSRRLLRAYSPAAFAAVMLVASAAPATATCQSGNSANGTTAWVLSHVNCLADGSGGGALAVGSNALALNLQYFAMND
jgi:hypothetical protein